MSCGVYEIIDFIIFYCKLIDSNNTTYAHHETTNISVCCCLQIIMLVVFIGGMRNNNNNNNNNKKRITCNVCVDERIIRKMKVQGQKLSFLCCYCSVSYFFLFFFFHLMLLLLMLLLRSLPSYLIIKIIYICKKYYCNGNSYIIYIFMYYVLGLVFIFFCSYVISDAYSSEEK